MKWTPFFEGGAEVKVAGNILASIPTSMHSIQKWTNSYYMHYYNFALK